MSSTADQDAPSPDPAATLVPIERVLAEQRQRWQNGDFAAVERYLQKYPALAADEEAVLQLIFNEVVLREHDGSLPRLEEYLGRFPQLAEQLKMQFALDSAMRGLASARTSLDETQPSPASGAVEADQASGFELGALLGKGGMGVVFRAYQIELKRTVALKMIRDGALAGPGELDRFRREAQMVARFQHPNIVQVYQVGERGGLPYCALEFVEGGTLAQRLAKNPLPPREAADLVQRIAFAVDYAHERGILHRDLKPANILLTTAGEPKVTDFGLAKHLDPELSGQTQSGAVVGTPSYMAPEQASGAGAHGPEADVYSLGAILYECLTGRPPFKAASVLDTLEQVRNQEPVPPSLLQRNVPRDLETICLKCLQKLPARRYRTAVELANDLGRFLGGEPILARRVGLMERAWKWARRHKLRTAFLIVLAGLFLLGLALFEQRVQQAHQEVKDTNAAEEHLRAYEAFEADKNFEKARAEAEQLWLLASRWDSLAPLAARAEQIIAMLDERQEVQQKQADFRAAASAALLHIAGVTGLEKAKAVQQIRQQGWAALESAPSLSSLHLSEKDKAELKDSCYSLILLLADRAAEPQPGAKGDPEAALQTLDLIRAWRTPTAVYHQRRAAYLDQLGRAKEAAAERADAERLRDQPVRAIDEFVLGMDRFKRNDASGALAHFEAASEMDPGLYWPRFFAALCYRDLGQLAQSDARLDTCRIQRPDMVWVHVLRGFVQQEQASRVLEDSRRSPAARWALAQNNYQEAERLYQRATELSSDQDVRYTVATNRGLLRLIFAQAMGKELPPAHLGVLLGRADAYHACLGLLQHRRHEQLRASLADLDQAIALCPEKALAHHHRAWCLEELNDLPGARRAVDAALKLEEKDAGLYRTRARIMRKGQQIQTAVADLEKAISLEGETLDRLIDYNDISDLLLQGNNPGAALQTLEAALNFRGLPGRGPQELARTQRLWASALLQWVRTGASAQPRQDLQLALAALNVYLEQAGQALESYLQRGEPVAQAYLDRGLVNAGFGQYAAAYADYGRAVELRPQAATYARRGWLMLEWAGVPKLARIDFEAALRLDPYHADASAGRGMVCVLSNQPTEARADAEKALRLGDRKNSRHLANVARIYAQLYARALAAPGSGQAEESQQRAFDLLRQALRVCPAPERAALLQVLAADRALEPLRSHAAYGQLMKELR